MSLFKFKKAKVMVGEFDPDDEDEWTLLIKPQIQDVTLFVHFHKKWNVTEVPGTPEIEEDEANGIEYQAATPGVSKLPIVHVFTGFVKEGNFVLDKHGPFSYQSLESVKKDYVKRLTTYTEKGFTKDWNQYSNDVGQKPKYFGSGPEVDFLSGNGITNSMQPASIATQPLSTQKILKHIMLGKAQVTNKPIKQSTP